MYPETINKYIEFTQKNDLSILDNSSDNFIVTPTSGIPDHVIGKVRDSFSCWHIKEEALLVNCSNRAFFVELRVTSRNFHRT